MGFAEVYGHILSYFGIGFLGLGILVSICAIIPACYWIFSSLSNNRGSLVFRRMLVILAVFYISFSYLRSPVFFEAAGWWKVTFFSAAVIGFIVPLLRLDMAGPERRSDRGIAMVSGLWWGLLVFSEALLVSGAPHQVIVLYLFTGVAGLLCGGTLGSTLARTARRRPSEAAPTAEGR